MLLCRVCRCHTNHLRISDLVVYKLGRTILGKLIPVRWVTYSERGEYVSSFCEVFEQRSCLHALVCMSDFGIGRGGESPTCDADGPLGCLQHWHSHL